MLYDTKINILDPQLTNDTKNSVIIVRINALIHRTSGHKPCLVGLISRSRSCFGWAIICGSFKTALIPFSLKKQLQMAHPIKSFDKSPLLIRVGAREKPYQAGPYPLDHRFATIMDIFWYGIYSSIFFFLFAIVANGFQDHIVN